MNYKSLNSKFIYLFLAPTIGTSIFIILTTIAMFFYAGGTEINHNLTHYDFFRNFFSDLGRTYVHDGRSNLVSSILFTLAASICGILLIPYFILLLTVPFENPIKIKFAKMASSLSFIAAPGYVAIGVIPCNLNLNLHLMAVGTAFLGSLPITMIYGLLLINHCIYPKSAGRLFLLFSVLLLGYLGIMAAFPDPTQIDSLIIQVVGQKIIIYAEMSMMWIQGIIAYKWAKNHH